GRTKSIGKSTVGSLLSLPSQINDNIQSHSQVQGHDEKMIDNVNKRRQYIEIKPIDRNQMMQDKSNIGFYKCEWKRIGVKERIFVKKLKARFCNHGKRYLFIFKVKIKDIRKDYVSEQLEKRKQENPETNRCMLLKNVSTRESPQETFKGHFNIVSKTRKSENKSKNPKDFKETSKVPNYKEVIAKPKNKNQVNEQNKDQLEEIKQLKDQIALLQATVQQLKMELALFLQLSA
ncbi:hypothetical protein RFI_38362, partial [Reticulomyxa filosa]